MLYVVVQGRRTVRPELLWILGSLVWVFCYGSAGGPFQSDALLNRLAHASCSAVLAGLLCWELSVLLIARHRTLGSAALGWACAMATGAGMELMEGAVAWNDVQPTRFHDTMFDLTADAAGAVAGVVLAAWVVRRERVRRPRP
jgi:membrane associated rhomboid family serine protease